MSVGYVYVLVMEGTTTPVKVGFTGRTPEIRAAELARHAGVPRRLIVVDSWRVTDMEHCEREAHIELDESRTYRRKEWFDVEADEAVARVQEVCRPFLVSWAHAPNDKRSDEPSETPSGIDMWTRWLENGDIYAVTSFLREPLIDEETCLSLLRTTSLFEPLEEHERSYEMIARLVWAACVERNVLTKEVWWHAVRGCQYHFVFALTDVRPLHAPSGEVDTEFLSALLWGVTDAWSMRDHARGEAHARVLRRRIMNEGRSIPQVHAHLSAFCQRANTSGVFRLKPPAFVVDVVTLLGFAGGTAEGVPLAVDRFAIHSPKEIQQMLPVGMLAKGREVLRGTLLGIIFGVVAFALYAVFG